MTDSADIQTEGQNLPAAAKDELEQVEDQLFWESAGILKAALRFSEVEMYGVDENGKPMPLTEPPPDWVAQYPSYKEALKAFRIAQAANMPNAQAPAGLKMALEVYRGVLASRGNAGAGGDLPVMVVQVNTHVPSLPTRTTKKVGDGR